MSEKLPDKINEDFLMMSENAREVYRLIREYNKLPKGDIGRLNLYSEIASKVEYEQYFE